MNTHRGLPPTFTKQVFPKTIESGFIDNKLNEAVVLIHLWLTDSLFLSETGAEEEVSGNTSVRYY